MKKYYFFVLLFIGASALWAQSSSNNRVSPMDSTKLEVENLEVKVIYSRPFLKGREFGKTIVPYGKVWRTGANEATVFEINNDVRIEGELLPAGKYSLYSIPDEKETTVIFNKDWDQWGLKYDESRDALRVTVPTFHVDYSTEQFTIDLEPEGEACLTWGTVIFMFRMENENQLSQSSGIMNLVSDN